MGVARFSDSRGGENLNTIFFSSTFNYISLEIMLWNEILDSRGREGRHVC